MSAMRGTKWGGASPVSPCPLVGHQTQTGHLMVSVVMKTGETGTCPAHVGHTSLHPSPNQLLLQLHCHISSCYLQTSVFSVTPWCIYTHHLKTVWSTNKRFQKWFYSHDWKSTIQPKDLAIVSCNQGGKCFIMCIITLFLNFFDNFVWNESQFYFFLILFDTILRNKHPGSNA